MGKTTKVVEKEKTLDLYNSDREEFYTRMSAEQKAMYNSIRDNIFTFCEANAGSGKTLCSVNAMVELLAEGKISKIIYIQKPSERYLSNGFLPGTAEDKLEMLYTPLYDALNTLGFFDSAIEEMIDKGMLQCISDMALRGVNIKSAGVILDEGQNLDYHTLKLILTRCSDDSHIVMIGDSLQRDNRRASTDFVAYGNYLAEKPFGNKVKLTHNYRGIFSQTAEKFIFEG